MREEEWRARLTEVLESRGDELADADAGALLPTVRDIVAGELRAVAGAIDDDARVSEARNLGQAQRVAGEARSVVLERADALQAAP